MTTKDQKKGPEKEKTRKDQMPALKKSNFFGNWHRFFLSGGILVIHMSQKYQRYRGIWIFITLELRVLPCRDGTRIRPTVLISVRPYSDLYFVF